MFGGIFNYITMHKRLLFAATLLAIGTASFGQNCVEINQLERMLISSISFEEIEGFLKQNSYYQRSSNSSTLVLEKDSISTTYFKNSNYRSYVTIHVPIGNTSRIVEYYNDKCINSLILKLHEENYVLINDVEIKTYRKGNKTILYYPNGTLVLYGKSTNEFRSASQKRRENRQARLAQLESQFVKIIETYQSKLLNHRLNSDAADYSQLFNNLNDEIIEGFKTRNEFLALKNDILNSWKVKLSNEVNIKIKALEFGLALDIVSQSGYPNTESVEEIVNLIVDKRLSHELGVLEQSLKDALSVQNYERQVQVTAQIITHPMVSAVQKSQAEKIRAKALETQQLLSKRRSSTLSYWQNYPKKKTQVEKILQEYVLSKAKRTRQGEFSFSMSVQFDTLGVNRTRYYLEPEDKNLTSVVNEVLTPLVLSKLYFKASDSISFSASWSKDRLVSVSSYKGITHSNFNSWNNEISSLISRSTSKYGAYKFDILEITINGRQYSSIQFVNHRVGSSVLSNFVKSLIIPGLGRRATNYGQPNKKFQEILVFGITAFGAEFYSQNILRTYNQDPTNIELFEEAQSWHRISLSCAAIGAFDYISEQFYVLFKSFRNLSDSRKTNQELKTWSKNNLNKP